MTSLQSARDALHARAEQQAYEINELRRQEGARTKEYEAFLKREGEARAEIERVLGERTAEVEQQRASCVQVTPVLAPSAASVP